MWLRPFSLSTFQILSLMVFILTIKKLFKERVHHEEVKNTIKAFQDIFYQRSHKHKYRKKSQVQRRIDINKSKVSLSSVHCTQKIQRDRDMIEESVTSIKEITFTLESIEKTIKKISYTQRCVESNQNRSCCI